MEDGKDENENCENLKYMEGCLSKKETQGKWVEYWVICRGKYLLFYSHRCQTSELRDAFRGLIELTLGTRCLIGKRKKYNFPFYLVTQKSRYYFKTNTALSRHQWIHAIDLSVQGHLPESPPKFLPSPTTMARRAQEADKFASDEKDLSNDSINVSADSDTIPIISQPPIDIETEPDNEVVHHTEDIPKHVIVVKSINDGDRGEVTNFTGDNVSSNTNNYRVTNFMQPRNDEKLSAKSNGVVNLSFEEEKQEHLTNKKNCAKNDEHVYSNGDVTKPVIKYPPMATSSAPSYHLHRSDKWLNRTTRSAESNRGRYIRNEAYS
eukprot:gene15138-16694_t